MKLREEIFVLQRGSGHALGEFGDFFRDVAHVLFVFRRKEKRTQEGTVHAVAKSQLRAAHAFEQLVRKTRNAQQRGFQKFVPILGGIGGGEGGGETRGVILFFPAAAARGGRGWGEILEGLGEQACAGVARVRAGGCGARSGQQ